MADLLTIDRNNKLPKAQDYNFLRKEGIRYIEDLSGKVWTDYNTHDPGITLLEAMCYALTDLGYRTSFNIEDLLAPKDKSSADAWKKLFYTAREALPCNPLTLIDYRKLIIDTEGVRNAWIEISDDYEILLYLQKEEEAAPDALPYSLTYDYKKGDDILHIRGLYKVFVEYEDDILEEKKEEEVAKVIWHKLHFHRNLTEDFISVSSIEYEYFPVEAIIQVSEGTDIEMINAKIYKVIHDFFSPPISFYSLEQMLERNSSPEEVFDGPILNYGFIDTGELVKSERYKNIHLSDVINLISGIEGVIAVKKFAFPVDSASPFSNFTEWINIVKDKQKTPKLDIVNSNISFERSGDRHRTEAQKQVNKSRVNAMFAFLKSDNFKTRLRGSGKDLPIPEGEFMDVAEYFPFQQNLPEVYGMMETLIDDKERIDKFSVDKAVSELLAQSIGMNGAKLFDKLLNETRDRQYIEKLIADLVADASEDGLLRTIINKLWEDKAFEKQLKKITAELLGGNAEKASLYAYLENNVEYRIPSGKSVALYELANQKMSKPLAKINSSGDIAKLDALYKKYQVDLLSKRKKLILQLRGFLMTFEQILSDYLSQLSRAREIFSFEEDVAQVFYPELISNIHDVEALYIDFKHYRDTHLDLIETKESFGIKRNNILDHLVSRFSESMDKYSFFMRQFAGKEADSRLIKDKAALLQDYVQVSSYRGKGYDYADPDNYWDSKNVEGVKKRICRLLGIRNYKRQKIAPRNIFTEKITLDNNVQRYIVTVLDPKDTTQVLLRSNDFEFESEAIIILTYILEQGYDRSLYKKEGHGDKWHFVLTRLNPENEFETIASSDHFSTGNERDAVMDKVFALLEGFSDDENFHVLEHILLRPKIASKAKGASGDEVTLLPVEPLPAQIAFVDKEQKDTPYKFKIVQVKDQSRPGMNLWKLSLMKNDVEFLKINEDFIFYKHLTKRMEHIRKFASDSSGYTTEPTIDGAFTFKIISGQTVLAESKKNYKKTEDIDEEIKNLVNFLSYEFGLVTGVVDDNSPSMYADPYSFQLSIILPSWQRRFRNSTFKHLLEKTIYLETPAHIYPHVYWADHNEMKEFDEAYEVWVREMATNEIPATDVVNNLIDVLTKLRN